jgi:hypothetical protein
MDEEEKRTDDRKAGKSEPKSEREARLAAALRDNLRRRKGASKPDRSSES